MLRKISRGLSFGIRAYPGNPRLFKKKEAVDNMALLSLSLSLIKLNNV